MNYLLNEDKPELEMHFGELLGQPTWSHHLQLLISEIDALVGRIINRGENLWAPAPPVTYSVALVESLGLSVSQFPHLSIVWGYDRIVEMQAWNGPSFKNDRASTVRQVRARGRKRFIFKDTHRLRGLGTKTAQRNHISAHRCYTWILAPKWTLSYLPAAGDGREHQVGVRSS